MRCLDRRDSIAMTGVDGGGLKVSPKIFGMFRLQM